MPSPGFSAPNARFAQKAIVPRRQSMCPWAAYRSELFAAFDSLTAWPLRPGTNSIPLDARGLTLPDGVSAATPSSNDAAKSRRDGASSSATSDTRMSACPCRYP